MSEASLVKENNNTLIFDVIGAALKVPGVRVHRGDFLMSTFRNADPAMLERILEVGPVDAGYGRKALMGLARGLVSKRTLESSGLSFVAGLPGGLAMAGTIPADIAQFYGIALRLAQEVGYLYGMKDIWGDGDVVSDEVVNTFALYIGVMLGASGASATVKAMASALAAQALKKLPQKALTKTFYYPIIKSIAKYFGQRMTKEVFAKGVSKAIPILGGIASGGLTLVSMHPMGMRLVECLDEAKFDYTEEDLERDVEEIKTTIEAEEEEERAERETSAQGAEESGEPVFDYVEELRRAKSLLDAGIIDEEEFASIKERIISKI